MKITRIVFLVIYHTLFYLSGSASTNKTCIEVDSLVLTGYASEEFTAVNDTFYFVTNCASKLFTGNILKNDNIPNADVKICFVFAPQIGEISFGSNGNFTLTLPEKFEGFLEFNYILCETNSEESESVAKVSVFVENDNDCDGVVNRLDLDNDNDGMLDADEGNGKLDFDGDGIADNYDIDSDNDGISDNEEWQKEGNYIKPSQIDANNNGWDDAYDVTLNGTYYEAEDTDSNGIPDYLDDDSDGDGFPDCTEGFDNDGDGIADISPVNTDTDNDGLDDAFDVISCWTKGCNSTGSCSPLPDKNKNGIRDWREAQNEAEDDGNSKLDPDFNNILIYPNPSDGNFSVVIPELTIDEKIYLKIFNSQGIEIFTEVLSSTNHEIKTGIDSPGNYILLFQSEKINHRSKLVIY